MARELEHAFRRVNDDDAVAAVVVTGSGRAFCAGMDLSREGNVFGLDESLTPTLEDLTERLDSPEIADGVRDTGGRVSLAIYDCTKPVIAAINGPAVGIGATMTLPMDVRLASTSARIGFVFGRLGIVPEACSSWFLPRLVGVSRALEWTYAADILSPAEALDGGLVRSVVEPEALLDTAYELARRFVSGRSRVATALTRQMMWRNSAQPHPAGGAPRRLARDVGRRASTTARRVWPRSRRSARRSSRPRPRTCRGGSRGAEPVRRGAGRRRHVCRGAGRAARGAQDQSLDVVRLPAGRRSRAQCHGAAVCRGRPRGGPRLSRGSRSRTAVAGVLRGSGRATGLGRRVRLRWHRRGQAALFHDPLRPGRRGRAWIASSSRASSRSTSTDARTPPPSSSSADPRARQAAMPAPDRDLVRGRTAHRSGCRLG